MRGGIGRAAMLAAAMMGFAGAQRLDSKSLLAEDRQRTDFDPTAALRAASQATGIPMPRQRRGRKPRKRGRGSQVAHCGAKQCRKYFARPLWFTMEKPNPLSHRLKPVRRNGGRIVWVRA